VQQFSFLDIIIGMNEILITKNSGEKEPFAEEKLRNSLLRSGAGQNLAEKIIPVIKEEIKNGVLTSTADVYRRAWKILRKESRVTASRYHLRRAIMEMGPSGHPFERFVARVFESRGYKTAVSVIVSGTCVSHEIDVVAENKAEKIAIECKFHNQLGIKSDVKTALYVQARFEDIRKSGKDSFSEIWLVTNTKLSKDATQYGECVGMKMLAWSYPARGNLQELVENAGLHPVTCVTGLSSGQKRFLCERGAVLCRDIIERPEALRDFNFSVGKKQRIINEAKNIIESMNSRIAQER